MLIAQIVGLRILHVDLATKVKDSPAIFITWNRNLKNEGCPNLYSEDGVKGESRKRSYKVEG